MKDKTHGNWRRVERTPVSAGFVEDGVCTGYSETLKLKARPQDTAMLMSGPKEASRRANEARLVNRVVEAAPHLYVIVDAIRRIDAKG